MEIILRNNDRNVHRMAVDLSTYTEEYSGNLYIDETMKIIRIPPLLPGTTNRRYKEFIVVIDAKKKLNINAATRISVGYITDGTYLDEYFTALNKAALASGLTEKAQRWQQGAWQFTSSIPYGLKFKSSIRISVNMPYWIDYLTGEELLPDTLSIYTDGLLTEVWLPHKAHGDFAAFIMVGESLELMLGAASESCMATIEIYSKIVVEGV